MAARGDIISQVTPQLLESISQELLDMGVKMVVLKMGSCGIYLRTAPEQMLKSIGRAKPFNEKNWANCERWIPCFKVKVVGTTGSGDSAIAGFLSALLRSCTIDEALAIAVAAGACNVEALDSLSGLRTWDATRERVKKGWEQLPLDPGTPGWNWDENKKMWIGPLEGKHQ